jgi:hypothetical protein
VASLLINNTLQTKRVMEHHDTYCDAASIGH